MEEEWQTFEIKWLRWLQEGGLGRRGRQAGSRQAVGGGGGQGEKKPNFPKALVSEPTRLAKHAKKWADFRVEIKDGRIKGERLDSIA